MSRPFRAHPLAAPAGLILAVIAVILASGVAMSLYVAGSVDELRTASLEASDRLRTAQEVLDTLQDAETGLRGYLLTGRQAFLDPYQGTAARLDASLARLERLADATPWLQAEANALRAAARQRMALVQQAIFLSHVRGPQAALELAGSEADRASMIAVRRHVATIIGMANAERERRNAELVAREDEATYGLALAGGLGAVLLGFAALRLLVSRGRLVRTQDALRVQSERLQGTVDHVRDGIAVFDPYDRLLLWNPSFFPRCGLSPALARVGTPFAAFAEAASDWRPPLLALPRPQDAPHLIQFRHAGRTLEVWRSAMPDGGQMVAVADVTRRTEAEAIARQTQKLQALGHLTGGVAHDFNNLLQVISANLEALGSRLGQDGWPRARLAAALAGVERGARLTRHLLAFARRQPLAPEVVDTAALLHGIEDLLHRALNETITLALSVADGLWTVKVDPSQLENALLNLAINARDAMPQGGRLVIEAGNVTLGPGAAEDDPEARPGDYVTIAVTDNGVGMDAEQRARAMEPFYTTKPEGQGTGLGLSMVYGFATQSGGRCTLTSRRDAGTSVRLLIPRCTDPVSRHPASLTPSLAPSLADGRVGEAATLADGALAGRRVLLVEDDALLRAATADLLAELGLLVAEAPSATSALGLLDAGTEILITDFRLPDMDGLTLSAAARRRLPDLPVIVTSGNVAGPDADPSVIWLAKPYDRAALRAAIDRAAPDPRRFAWHFSAQPPAPPAAPLPPLPVGATGEGPG